MKQLVKFHWDCGRMGNVEGLFVCDDEDALKNAVGKIVHFGEILGKHSDVYGILEQDDITIVSTDQDKIDWLVSIIGNTTISGYNPLEYLVKDDE